MNKSNKDKYLILRITHFLKGLVFSVFYSFFYTKRNKTIIFNSACNQDFTWNSKSLFLNGREKLNSLGYSTYYIITDHDKRALLNEKYGNYFIDNKSLKNLHLIYTSSVWVLSTLETPCSGIFLNRYRFVYHLGHGTPIKNIGLCEKKPSILKKVFYLLNDTNISLYLSTSSFFSNYMKKAFRTKKSKIIVSPQPRIEDILKGSTSNINFTFDENKKYILYAPTWRPYDKTVLFPFDSFNIDEFNKLLIELNIIILIRLHPRFEDDLDTLTRSNIINFGTKRCPDISDALRYTNAIITDYSSIYCDYLILKKPVALLPYDLEKYKQEIGFSYSYNKIFPDSILDTYDDFLNFIISIKEDSFDTQSQENLCEKLNFIPRDTSITEYNINIIEKEYKLRWPLE